MITPHQAKYFSHELTLRRSSDTVEKFSSTLSNAQVDINPHQIEAALFAFRSPLSKGAILADEVGLGKTIEAGIVIAQKWAEKKKKILLIVPANLRKQWMVELSEKFFLPSVILENKSFNAFIKEGNLNPLNQENAIVIASYQFIKWKSPYVKQIPWDLVVVDEAHRLRNVYKTANKTAREIRSAIAHAPKILLTATPLQNSLLELYGLVSIIDEHHFWDLKSFKAKYSRVSLEQKISPEEKLESEIYGNDRPNAEMFLELRNRLAPICIRTLRRQVLEYIKYTKRIPLTQDYYPGEDETLLYEKVSDYLQTKNLYALPASQRQLVTMILRKLLASSSFAIAQTLERLIYRLNGLIKEAKTQIKTQDEEGNLDKIVLDMYDSYEEAKDEWIDDEEGDDDEIEKPKKEWTEADIVLMKQEVQVLEESLVLAKKIFQNSKGDSLLIALKRGFDMTREIGGNQKALIFTESTVTQNYLKDLLEENGYKWKVLLFNGSNNDPESKRIYGEWLEKYKDTDKVTGSKTADMRAALVDRFKNAGEIMIATEAGAEGINLQFCSLLINYDLPWNPQRIEQRIGRCHRYGQKHDVVVINFINRRNAADQRIFELLDSKFNLFKWVFWASDEVLWVIESWVDFEKRIAKIYQECRTEDEINVSFDALQKLMDDSIKENLWETRQKLLENFDEDVRERLKSNKIMSEESLETFDKYLWALTQWFLADRATFSEKEHAFTLEKNPFPDAQIPPWPYRMGRDVDEAHIYRPEHPLAHNIITTVQDLDLPEAEIVFDYSNHRGKISVLESLVGTSGYLQMSRCTIEALDIQDEILVSAIDTQWKQLDPDTCRKLLRVSGKVVSQDISIDSWVLKSLNEIEEGLTGSYINSIDTKNSNFFDEEIAKLEKWSDDMKTSVEIELKRLDVEISTLRTQARKIIQLEQKLEAQKSLKELEKKRSEMRHNLYQMQDDIDNQKDTLLSTVEARLKKRIQRQEILRIKFNVK